MLKKLSLLAMAVAALAALVAPAAAHAEGKLTSNGQLIEPGKVITFTQDPGNPLVTESALGELNCNVINAHAVVVTNDGTNFTGEGTGGNTAECLLNETVPVTVTEPTVIDFHSTTTGTGTTGLTFIVHIPVGGGKEITCHFETVEDAIFHYAVPSDTVTITPAVLVSELCGEAEIAGSATVETSDGTPVIAE